MSDWERQISSGRGGRIGLGTAPWIGVGCGLRCWRSRRGRARSRRDLAGISPRSGRGFAEIWPRSGRDLAEIWPRSSSTPRPCAAAPSLRHTRACRLRPPASRCAIRALGRAAAAPGACRVQTATIEAGVRPRAVCTWHRMNTRGPWHRMNTRGGVRSNTAEGASSRALVVGGQDSVFRF